MTGPDLKVRLLEELDPRLQKVGFARWSDKSGFYGDRYHRWQNSMRQSISPSIIAEGEFLEFGVGQIGLRLDGVEELVRKFEDPVPAALSSPDDNGVSSTIGLRLEPKGFLSILQHPRMLRNVEEVVKTAEGFVAFAMKKGQPFWDRFSNSEEVLKVLSGATDDSSDYTVSDVITTKRAIALSLILHGDERARSLAESRDAVLRERGRIKTANEIKRWADKALASYA